MTCSVLVVGLPPAARCAPGRTWRAAAAFVQQRLVQRFGDRVTFEHGELFSPDMARHPDAEADIAADRADLPIVVIHGVRRFSGGKLYVSAIEREVADAVARASAPGTTSAPRTGGGPGTTSAPRTGGGPGTTSAPRTGPPDSSQTRSTPPPPRKDASHD